MWGRARPRDFYDVDALTKHYGREQLLMLAAAKDAGFSASTFLDALHAINRLTSADWAEDGIDLTSVPTLRAAFADWHSRLTGAEG